MIKNQSFCNTPFFMEEPAKRAPLSNGAIAPLFNDYCSFAAIAALSFLVRTGRTLLSG